MKHVDKNKRPIFISTTVSRMKASRIYILRILWSSIEIRHFSFFFWRDCWKKLALFSFPYIAKHTIIITLRFKLVLPFYAPTSCTFYVYVLSFGS